MQSKVKITQPDGQQQEVLVHAGHGYEQMVNLLEKLIMDSPRVRSHFRPHLHPILHEAFGIDVVTDRGSYIIHLIFGLLGMDPNKPSLDPNQTVELDGDGIVRVPGHVPVIDISDLIKWIGEQAEKDRQGMIEKETGKVRWGETEFDAASVHMGRQLVWSTIQANLIKLYEKHGITPF